MAGRHAGAVITRYAGLQVQTSSLGVNIPVGWGTFRCKCNLVDYLDFRSVAQRAAATGKGGATVTGYSYSATVIMAICEGPIDGISVAYVNGKVLTNGARTALAQAGLTLNTGAVGQSVWSYLTTNHADHAIGYSGLAICYAARYPLDSGATTPNHSFEVVRLASFGVAGTEDADPSLVVSDFFTNGRYGVPSWGAGLLDAASLAQYQDYCLAAGLLVSPVIDQQTSASAFLTELFRATNATCVWSEGVLKFIPYGDTALTGHGKSYTPNNTPVYSLDDDHFLPASDGKAPVVADIQDQSDAYNVVQLEYLDRTNQYNMAIALASDAANVAQYGMRRKTPDTVHCICDPNVAAISAHLHLQRTLYIRAQYRFTLGWMFALLEPGDIVEISDAGLGLAAYPVRIIQIDEDDKCRLSVIAEDCPIGVAHTPLYTMQNGQGLQINQAVDPGGVEANLLLWSQDFTNAVWTPSALTVTAGATTNPVTAASDAHKLTPTTANTAHYIFQAIPAFASASYTFTVYLKAAGYNDAVITIDDGGGVDQVNVEVDLNAGVVVSSAHTGAGLLGSASISSAGAGWYLVQVTGQIPATTIAAQINVANNAGATTFAGDGTSGVYAWGAQVYQGPPGRIYAATASAIAGPVIFNPPSVLTQGGLETWAAVAGGPDWAGAYVWVSLDGGSTYEQITNAGGLVAAGGARFGAASLTSGADPDTTNACGVDLTMSGGSLTSAADSVADGSGTLCLIDNELISFSTATLTSPSRYNLTGYIRRGVQGTAIAGHSAARFVRLDGAPIVLPFLPVQSGVSAFVKFQSFNAWGEAQSLADCVAYPFTPATNPAGTSPNGNNAYGGELLYTSNPTYVGSVDPATLGSVPTGAFWFNNATGIFFQRHGGAWLAVNAVADGTVLYSSMTPGSWSFTVPATALGFVLVEIWGAGGGGQEDAPTFGGYGGNSGAYAAHHFAVTPGSTVIAGTIGAGGQGDFSPSGGGFNPATSGGATTITSPSVSANGGGTHGAAAASASGGNVANTSGNVGTTSYGAGAPGGGGNAGHNIVGTNPGGGGGYGVWQSIYDPSAGGYNTYAPYGASGMVKITAKAA